MEILLGFFIEIIKLYLLQRLMGYSTTKKLVLPCCLAIASFVSVWLLIEVLTETEIISIYMFLTLIITSSFIKGRNKILSAFLGVPTVWFVDVFFDNTLMMLFSRPIGLFSDSISLIILSLVFIVFKLKKKPHLIRFETLNKKQVLFYVLGLFSFALYTANYQVGIEYGVTQVDRLLAILSSISGIFLIAISINAVQKSHYKEFANITEKIKSNIFSFFWARRRKPGNFAMISITISIV